MPNINIEDINIDIDSDSDDDEIIMRIPKWHIRDRQDPFDYYSDVEFNR